MDQPSSSYHIEQERRANDLLRVYNPTDEDYTVVWDKRSGGKVFRIKAKSEQVLVRYIAEKYIKEMYQKILNEKVDKAVIKTNEDRVLKGMAEMTKYAEQYRFESPLLRPSAEEAKKVIAILYVGMDSQFGVDNEAVGEEEAPQDKPVFDTALDDVQKERISEPAPQPQTKKFKCDYPDCGREFDANIALMGHKRSHREKTVQDVTIETLDKNVPDAILGEPTIEVKKQEAVSNISQ